jgi:hypothetical protein
MQEEPICCRLEANAYKDRVAWIAALTRRTLRSCERDGLTLRLSYDPDGEADVSRMVAQERLCCPFLAFEIVRNPGEVTVTITAPESAGDAVDALFRLFLLPAPERIA